MGTSSIFDGKKDRKNLLPNDFQEKEPLEMPKQRSKISWTTVKSGVSKYVKSSEKNGSVQKIIRNYVKASGGSKNLLKQSISGIATGERLTEFLNSIDSGGLSITLDNFGVDYLGKSVDEVFSVLINILAPSSSTKEEIVAREAAQEALTKLYDYIENNEMSLETLDSLSDELINEVVCEYVGAYIWIQMMSDLESRLEKYESNPEKAISIEQEFKEYVFSAARIAIEEDRESLETKKYIESVYCKCIDVLEGFEW